MAELPFKCNSDCLGFKTGAVFYFYFLIQNEHLNATSPCRSSLRVCMYINPRKFGKHAKVPIKGTGWDVISEREGWTMIASKKF